MLRTPKSPFERPSPMARVTAVGAILLCGLLVAGLRGPAGLSQALVEDKPPITAQVEALEFRILASKERNKAIVEQAEANPAESVLFDASGKRLAWWVPVKAGEEKNLANQPDIVQRTATRDSQEVTEVLVLADAENVTGKYVVKAEAARDYEGKPCMQITFNHAGEELFAKLTGDHLPDPSTHFCYKLGIIVDGKLLSAPALQSTIGSHAQITGTFTEQEVEAMAKSINGDAPSSLPHLTPKPGGDASN